MPILDQNTPQSYVPYLATGTGVFGSAGDPNGVQNGGIGSIYVNLLNGDVYVKTTVYATLTGWNLLGGGGGSGTVTTFSAGNLSPLFNSSVATATSTPALTFAQIVQNANLVFAGPASGAPANPTFRALTANDLSLAAAPPANGVQYNDGTNAFTASNGFLFDAASNTVQAGESTVLKGTLQIFAALSTGSVKHTVNNPTGNYVFIWGDSLPANNDLARFSVSGSNVTIGSVAASALGFPTINATDGVIPYRSSATAFSDSPLTRTSSSVVTMAGQYSYNNTATGSFGDSSGRGMTINGATLKYGFNFAGAWELSNNLFMNTANNHFGLPSTGKFTFGATVQSGDVGLAWRQAGVLRVTNASTGIGGLLVGGSTATPVGQTHLINGATGVQPLFLEAIASTSVATIKAETSAVQSFAFNPSGKLIGGCNIPTANQQFSAIGNAKSDVSTIGNVGTGVDNLLSFAIGANVLANNGDYAEFDAFGEFAGSVDTKTLKVVYGATTIFNTGAVAFGASNWRINAKILRTGASAGKSIVTFWCTDATTPFLQEVFITTESFTASKTVQFTGEATSNDDITQLHLESKLCVALTS